MSYIVADRVKESSTIVGTGTISLLGAAVGFRTFASQMSVGDTCSYVIANTTGSEWEVGIATYSSANTLTRTTVQSSTNANAVVNFSAGMKDVFISPTAQSVIDYNPITHQISNANSIVASPVASGVGNSLTITAGSGIGTGAGGSLILQAGLQASSGGDGKVIVKKVSGQTSNLQEWQNSDGTVVASIGNDGSIWTSGTNTVPLKPINYTYTGTLNVPPIIILSTPAPAQIGSTVDDYSGKWAGKIILSPMNTDLTSISFTDLQGLTNDLNLSSSTVIYPSLTSVSFPILTIIYGNLSLSNFSTITSLNLPLLKTIGGSVNLYYVSSLTTLNLPSLVTIGSLFGPQYLNSLTSINLPLLQTTGNDFGPSNLNNLTVLNVPLLKTVGGGIYTRYLPMLTSISFPSLTDVGTFSPNNMNAVTSISVPLLKTTASIGFNNMSSLTSISFPSLTTVFFDFNPNTMSSLTSISLPLLTIIKGTFSLSSMSALNSINAPLLTTIGSQCNMNNVNVLTSISLPAVTTIASSTTILNMAALTSISFPSIVRFGTTITSNSVISITSGTAALTTFQLPSTLLQVGNGGGNVVITSAALNQTSVDSILVRLAALDGTNGTTLFSTRTVTITGTSSTPSATGLAAKATLVARGCTVTTN